MLIKNYRRYLAEIPWHTVKKDMKKQAFIDAFRRSTTITQEIFLQRHHSIYKVLLLQNALL